MTRSRSALTIVASFFLGILTAELFLWLFPARVLPESPVLQTLGIRKPMVLGFMPYWLLNKAQKDSLSQLNRLTYFGLVVNSDGSLVQKDKPTEAEPGWHNLELGNFSEKLTEIPKGQVDTSLLIHQSHESTISALLRNPVQHAQTMVSQVEPIMKQHGFVDLNLDIESFREATPGAQENMITFLREVKKQMSDKNLGTLTTELTVSSLTKNHLMKPKEVGEISDRVVLMAYDFRYTGSYLAGAVAPIGGTGEKIEYDVSKSIELAKNVIPAEKIILGIPLYGYEWETLTYDPEGPVVPGTGKTATATRVAELLKTCTNCIKGRDELTGSPYLILPPNEDSAIQQIYYEDQESIQKKLDLANQHKLGGVAFWAIGYETPELLAPLNAYAKSVEWK